MSKSIHLTNEKKIQNDIMNRLSNKGFKYEIIDEEYKDLKLNKSHKYLLINSYLNKNNNEVFKGLRFHIERHNKLLINDFSKNYTKDEIVDLIMNDFISKWANCSTSIY